MLSILISKSPAIGAIGVSAALTLKTVAQSQGGGGGFELTTSGTISVGMFVLLAGLIWKTSKQSTILEVGLKDAKTHAEKQSLRIDKHEAELRILHDDLIIRQAKGTQ